MKLLPTLLLPWLFPTVAHAKQGLRSLKSKPTADPMADLARAWSQLSLDMIAASFGFLSPPGVARALSMVTTAEWNAMVPYTKDWLPVQVTNGGILDPDLVSPTVVRLEPNATAMHEAMSVGAFLVLAEVFDESVPCLGASARAKAIPMLETEGLALLKEYSSVEAETVADAVAFLEGAAQGRMSTSAYALAAKSTMELIMARREDGMNSRGDLSTDGLCYSDYTLYASANDPQPEVVKTDCSQIRYLSKWQQLRVPTADGGSQLRPWMAPYMARVIPFSLDVTKLWTVLTPPPSATDDEFRRQHTEVLEMSANLDDRGKVIAEFWADGPDSTLPPGHWHDIAIEMTLRRNLPANETMQLLFVQSQAAFDAGIAAWTTKRSYDSARPITAIQCLYEGQMVRTWLAPYKGIGEKDGGTWIPYQNANFVTPPFAEFVSGHSTFSEASATVLRNFFGSDEYGSTFTVKAGESLFEPKIDDPNDPNFVDGLTNVPNTGPGTEGYVPREDVVLSWDTFTDAARQAGDSRLYGGIHIEAGNEGGLVLGGYVGDAVWKQYQRLFVKDDGSICD